MEVKSAVTGTLATQRTLSPVPTEGASGPTETFRPGAELSDVEQLKAQLAQVQSRLAELTALSEQVASEVKAGRAPLQAEVDRLTALVAELKAPSGRS